MLQHDLHHITVRKYTTPPHHLSAATTTTKNSTSSCCALLDAWPKCFIWSIRRLQLNRCTFILILLLSVQFILPLVTAERTIATRNRCRGSMSSLHDVRLTRSIRSLIDEVDCSPPQCLNFDEQSVVDLCMVDDFNREELLNSTYMQSVRGHSNAFSLLTLFNPSEFGDYESRYLYLNRTTQSLCLQSRINSTDCTQCFKRLLQIDHQVFFQTNVLKTVLNHYDCRQNKDAGNRFVGFSFQSTCSQCEEKYTDWLLMTLLYSNWKDFYLKMPCLLDFCQQAELHCPHLRNPEANDYAGLPAFRCSDPYIDLTETPSSSNASSHSTGESDLVSENDSGDTYKTTTALTAVDPSKRALNEQSERNQHLEKCIHRCMFDDQWSMSNRELCDPRRVQRASQIPDQSETDVTSSGASRLIAFRSSCWSKWWWSSDKRNKSFPMVLDNCIQLLLLVIIGHSHLTGSRFDRSMTHWAAVVMVLVWYSSATTLLVIWSSTALFLFLLYPV